MSFNTQNDNQSMQAGPPSGGGGAGGGAEGAGSWMQVHGELVARIAAMREQGKTEQEIRERLLQIQMGIIEYDNYSTWRQNNPELGEDAYIQQTLRRTVQQGERAIEGLLLKDVQSMSLRQELMNGMKPILENAGRNIQHACTEASTITYNALRWENWMLRQQPGALDQIEMARLVEKNQLLKKQLEEVDKKLYEASTRLQKQHEEVDKELYEAYTGLQEVRTKLHAKNEQGDAALPNAAVEQDDDDDATLSGDTDSLNDEDEENVEAPETGE